MDPIHRKYYPELLHLLHQLTFTRIFNLSECFPWFWSICAIFSFLKIATTGSKTMKDHGSLCSSPASFEDPLEEAGNAASLSVLT